MTGMSEVVELTVFAAWPVLEEVVTPLDGKQSLQAFGSLIANVAP